MKNFTKMHGLGNDFIVLTAEEDLNSAELARLSRRLCARNTGIGADGILLLLPSKSHDIRMRIFNADGSEADMCGNGIRCLSRYAYDYALLSSTQFVVETAAGPKDVELRLFDGEVAGVSVNMGIASFLESDIPMLPTPEGHGRISLYVDGCKHDLQAVNVSVPHAVIFVDDIGAVDIAAIGSAIENSPTFPKKINVNFVERVNQNRLKVRTWERGAGATFACGSGSCASAVVAFRSGFVGRQVNVELEHGSLYIEYLNDGKVRMTGPATYVCEGRLL